MSIWASIIFSLFPTMESCCVFALTETPSPSPLPELDVSREITGEASVGLDRKVGSNVDTEGIVGTRTDEKSIGAEWADIDGDVVFGGMIVELRLDSCMRLGTMSLRVTSTPVAVALGQLSLASASLQTRKIVTSTKGGLNVF